MSIEVDDFLAHYGVKGMRWGVVKKEGPAPKLSAKRAEKAGNFEARAAKADIRIAEIQKEIANLPPGAASMYKKYTLNEEKSSNKIRSTQLKKDAKAVREGRLTSTQKKVLIGAIVVTALVGATVIYNGQQSGAIESLIQRGKQFGSGKPFEFKKNLEMARKDLSPDEVLAKVAKGVNPGYKTPGGQMNCRRASLTYELRRRGFDVTATTSELGYGQSESGLINALVRGDKNILRTNSLSSFVASDKGIGIRQQVLGDNRKNPGAIGSIALNAYEEALTAKDGHGKTINRLYDTLKAQPNGARGEAVFNFKQFGHSISWENFDGKPIFFDTQKGQKIENISDFFAKWGYPSSAELTRLDNLDLDLEFLSRWATDRKGKK